jgi:predicted metalloprotease with PDZ domain
LGVAFPSPLVEERYFKQQDIALGTVNVYITNVMNKSAAAEAGLKEGDIIQSIDGIQLSSSTEFSERIARHRPDDIIKLSYLRDGKVKTVSATLKRKHQQRQHLIVMNPSTKFMINLVSVLRHLQKGRNNISILIQE